MSVRRFAGSTQEMPLYTEVDSKIYEKEVLSLKPNIDEKTICVVGLGYVGLPLAEAFAKSLRVIGFDIKADKIAQLDRITSAA